MIGTINRVQQRNLQINEEYCSKYVIEKFQPPMELPEMLYSLHTTSVRFAEIQNGEVHDLCRYTEAMEDDEWKAS